MVPAGQSTIFSITLPKPKGSAVFRGGMDDDYPISNDLLHILDIDDPKDDDLAMNDRNLQK